MERFRSPTRTYFRGAAVVLLVFSLASRESFDKLPNWIESIGKDVSHGLCDGSDVSEPRSEPSTQRPSLSLNFERCHSAIVGTDESIHSSAGTSS